MALIALDQEESGWTEADGSKEELAEYTVTLLQSKSELLEEYFSLKIDNGNIMTLPYLLGRFFV